VLVTTTPRPIHILKRIRDAATTVTTTGRTDDNVNLDPGFAEAMIATYGGTRMGRQELDGELIEEVEGSLWPRDLMEGARLSAPARLAAEYDRIVVGVDPPAGVGSGVDACGIVVCGKRGELVFVIADESVQGLSPEGWANRVAAAAARWGASVVVAEANNGGAMVASVLRAADCPVKVKLVHASKGKVARAEPVALRFEAGKAFLAGRFPALEDQMAGMIAGGDYEGPGRSPDRADAMVWAMTELAETKSMLPRVRRL
jgi:phage terminase large subunit-like protein